MAAAKTAAAQAVDFGASVKEARFAGGAKGDGATLDDSAFLAAEAEEDFIYVPAGTYRLSTPMILNGAKWYYGPGALQFDKAEWWRKGGSAGSAPTEKYTVLYEFDSQSDVHISFNEVEQPILAWIGDLTFEVSAPATGVSVKFWAVNGRYRLSMTPTNPRSLMTILGTKHNASFTWPDPLATPHPNGAVNISAGALRTPIR